MAMKYHPDKNPNAGDKFKEISHVNIYSFFNQPLINQWFKRSIFDSQWYTKDE